MVQSSALKKFYLDLANELYVSQFAIYHRTVYSVLELYVVAAMASS